MEYGLRVERLQALPSDPRSACPAPWDALLPAGVLKALYFGSEFCEHRLPTAAEARAFCALARESGLEAVLLTPVCTARGVATAARLVDELTARGWAPAVVFNDWGVLDLLRRSHPDLPRRAGRLFNRALRDPRLAPERTPSSGPRGQRLRALLSRLGAQAIETDPDLEGGYLGDGTDGLQRALHLPYAFAASGRICLTRAETSSRAFLQGFGDPCGVPCRGHRRAVERPDTQVPLWRAGNTLFYEVPEALARAHLGQADRVVLHEVPAP